MWYFFWVLGTILACSCAVVTALAIEKIEDNDDIANDIKKEMNGNDT